MTERELTDLEMIEVGKLNRKWRIIEEKDKELIFLRLNNGRHPPDKPGFLDGWWRCLTDVEKLEAFGMWEEGE